MMAVERNEWMKTGSRNLKEDRKRKEGNEGKSTKEERGRKTGRKKGNMHREGMRKQKEGGWEEISDIMSRGSGLRETTGASSALIEQRSQWPWMFDHSFRGINTNGGTPPPCWIRKTGSSRHSRKDKKTNYVSEIIISDWEQYKSLGLLNIILLYLF